MATRKQIKGNTGRGTREEQYRKGNTGGGTQEGEHRRGNTKWGTQEREHKMGNTRRGTQGQKDCKELSILSLLAKIIGEREKMYPQWHIFHKVSTFLLSPPANIAITESINGLNYWSIQNPHDLIISGKSPQTNSEISFTNPIRLTIEINYHTRLMNIKTDLSHLVFLGQKKDIDNICYSFPSFNSLK